MLNIKCEACGSSISLDQQRTVNNYMVTMDYVISKDGKLDMDTIQEYMYYKCHSCNKTYKYTIKEVEREARRSFAETAMFLKRKEVLDDNKNKIDGDSVISYCGKCRGQDGNGNCFSAIMSSCSIRNKN